MELGSSKANAPLEDIIKEDIKSLIHFWINKEEFSSSICAK